MELITCRVRPVVSERMDHSITPVMQRGEPAQGFSVVNYDCGVRTRSIAWTVVVGCLAVACTNGIQVPAIDDETSAELRARTVWSACLDVACPGAPVLVDSSTPEDVRQQLAQFTDEIVYVSAAETEDRAPFGERFPDGATLFGVDAVRGTEKADVVGVDVSISTGPGDFIGRTYLFRWDGSAWISASADGAGVTVTSVVS